jgi:vibriolysin
VPRHGTSDYSVARGAWVHYNPLAVVAGSQVRVTLSGSGDPDLYIRFGSRPTTATYNCASYSPTATESCTVTVPAGQTQAYVGVYGYSAASYHLEADWVSPN